MAAPTVDPDFGPAVEGSALRTVLDLLQVRGCGISYNPATPGQMEAYFLHYPVLHMTRARMIYPDERGVAQALELLEEMNAETHFLSVANAHRLMLQKSFDATYKAMLDPLVEKLFKEST